jgi:hypothetical protein
LKPFVSYPSYQPQQSVLKGYLFEQWVVKQFNSCGFTLLEWRSDKEVNGIYPLSSKKPDLVVEINHMDSKIYYAIECKWRKEIGNGLSWASNRKIQEYEEFSIKMQTPVFVAIGVGGYPGNPENTYLIPLNFLHEASCTKEALLPEYLWPDTESLNKYIETYS